MELRKTDLVMLNIMFLYYEDKHWKRLFLKKPFAVIFLNSTVYNGTFLINSLAPAQPDRN